MHYKTNLPWMDDFSGLHYKSIHNQILYWIQLLTVIPLPTVNGVLDQL
jgi:hypothetical protein